MGNPPINSIFLLLTKGNIHSGKVKMFRVHLNIKLRDNNYLIKYINISCPSSLAVFLHIGELVKGVTNPRQIFAIKYNRARILNLARSATKEDTLCLRLGRHWVSGKDQVVIHCIGLADLQHSLKYLSVGGEKD